MIVTIGGAYYMMKKRRAQARINAKFVPPDVGHYEADRQGTDCNTIAYDDDSFMSPDGDSEIYYDSEEDDEDMSRMSVPVSPVSPVSPAITLTRPERAALSPIKTPKPSSIVSSVPRSPLGPITPGVATPASLASPFSPECPSPSWDRSSMTSSRPSGVTSPSIVAEQMASLQMARNLHVNRLARPLGKFDKLLVSPTESTNELRELTLWLAKDLGPRTPGSPSPCDFEEYKDGEDEKESTK